MKIREGAYYRTRGGDVVGPMRHVEPGSHFPWITLSRCWTVGGRVFRELEGAENCMDLISEVYVSDTPPDAKRETEAELREMMRDPRYWRTREPDFVKRVTEGFRALVGGDTPPADALPSDGSVNFKNCTVGTYTPAPETKTNGWPGKPGVPLNPEKDGWHWMKTPDNEVMPFEWRAEGECERGHWPSYWVSQGEDCWTAEECDYLGPCLTPDEVENLREGDAVKRGDAEQKLAHRDNLIEELIAIGTRDIAARDALQKRVATVEDSLNQPAADLKGKDD